MYLPRSVQTMSTSSHMTDGFLIYWLFVLGTSLVCSNKVHLMYKQRERDNDNFPTYVNISINSTPEGLNKLQLTKVMGDRLNIPLFVKGRDSSGKEFHQKENLADRKDTTFYVDKRTGTLIQLFKFGNIKDLKPEIKRGLFSFGGRRYKMNRKQQSSNNVLRHTSRYRMSSSNNSINSDDVDDVYDVDLEPEDIGSTFDFLLPPQVGKVVNVRPQAVKPQSAHFLFDNSSLPLRPVNSRQQDEKYNGETKNSPAKDPRFRHPIPPSVPPQRSGKPPNNTGSRFMPPDNARNVRRSFIKENLNEKRGQHRRHRRQTTVYYIDTVAVIDYSLYQTFLDSAGSRTQALEDIREYYAFLFTGVDLRYEGITNLPYTITVKLVKIVVLESAFDSSITEQFRVQSSGSRDQIDSANGLNAFKDWVVGTGSSLVTPYDHAALFTAYDLTRTVNGVLYDSTAGLAFTSTMCRTDGTSISIIEDKGAYQTMFTTAHEIGHGLSAYHDGDGNECSSGDDYIMAGGVGNGNDNAKLNPWIFSSCSIDYFRSFITEKISTSAGLQCLAGTQSISSDIPNVDDSLLGQQNSPDDQCKAIYGSGSYLCRSLLNPLSSICTSMYCQSPDSTLCYEHFAARGTSCGDGKICLEGQCVSDPRAPSLDESCPFGDDPGITFQGTTCPLFIADFSGYCYQDVVYSRCCGSCETFYHPVVDCLYGDKSTGCVTDLSICSFQSEDYKSSCCKSCQYGDPITTTTTSTTTTTTPVTTTPSTTTTTKTTTTSTTTASTTTTSTTTVTCSDSPSGIDGQSCSDAINQRPYLCYSSVINGFCCVACKQAETGSPDCLYGDRVSGCMWWACSSGDDNYNSNCCDTCNSVEPITTTTTLTTTPTTTTTTTSTNSESCINSPGGYNGQSCSAAISKRPYLCYSQLVLQSCCAACNQAETQYSDCLYGDRTPSECTELNDVYACQGKETNCCDSCRIFGGSSSITTSYQLIIALVVVTLCLLL